MPWTLYDTTTYNPNFASRIAAHGSGGLVWVSDGGADNRAIRYDIAGKVENIISNNIVYLGPDFKGSTPGNFAISSDGTNIFALSQHDDDAGIGGYDAPIWDHSTGANWSEVIDLGPSSSSGHARLVYIDGRFYAPKSWNDSSNIICWTSTDGVNWFSETVDPSFTVLAISGTFTSGDVPIIVKSSTGDILIAARLNSSQWQFFRRNNSVWNKVGIPSNISSSRGINHFPMGANETFSRIYRKVVSGAQRLQYSEDEGNTWADCISDTGETILHNQMSGATVVYSHSGREFIGYNRTHDAFNTYSLYEFNSLTKEFDYIDDMPTDTNSFQGAFVYNNELYIHHAGAIYKHDGLSFGEVVASEFDLKVAAGISKHAMDTSSNGLSIAFALEKQSNANQKVYLEDLTVAPSETKVAYDPLGGSRGNVYRIPATNTMLLTGLFGAGNNAQLYDIDADSLTNISFGASIIQPAAVSPNGKILAGRVDDIIERSEVGAWSDLTGSTVLFSSSFEAIAAIFFSGFLPDYIFASGTDDQGDKSLYFSPNNWDDISSMGGDTAWPDQDGTPVITGLDIAFDGT